MADNFDSKIINIQTMFELAKENNKPSDVVLVCRNVLEKAIDLIFEYEKVKKPVNATLLELINNQTVQSFLGTDVLVDSLHFVRIAGINALHGLHIKSTYAKVAIDNTEFLLNAINEKIGISKDNSLLAKKIENSEINISVPLSEKETRRIYIDLYLNEAGWQVVDPNTIATLPNGTKVKCGSVIPEKACSEVMVTGLPTATGIGFCDYVLYGKDGKPLAIVEAKKTTVDAHVGEQQVREYGQCMLKQYGYVPILYYTNGYDIFVIDGKYPARKIAAFHTIDELSYLIQKRNIKRIIDITVNSNIAGRPYQVMAITNICERFNDMHRRGLIVMATGTGKTRTAIALVDVLLRNNWVKNILFLADRTSLVRQAFNNFRKILKDMTYCVASDPSLADEPNARITFSTHQTMMNMIDSESKKYSAGHFDLIIIDEAHRSIFNKYGAIFTYFDSLLVGLTATPKEEVDANTYFLFNCESGIPNFSYSMEEAVKDHYLVPYKLINRKTKLMSEGIPYAELSEADKAELALLTDEEFDDDSIISTSKLFKKIYNVDTCRKVLDDLMAMGQRVDCGQVLGKTIIFAVNHFHAQLVVDTFNKMYPMYPDYCKLIDNQVKNSNHLIEEFEQNPDFRIAVSVDMLDTGIDVPSVLNLVFFKKVNSNIKLVQMIGRGTRLCDGLIDGKDKQLFYIFDYFNNFKDRTDDVVKQPVSITQRLFLIRLNMMCQMQTSEHQLNPIHKAYYLELKEILMSSILNVKKNGSERICVREVMDTVDKFCDKNKWNYISALNQKEIEHDLAPIVECDIKEEYLTLSFDYLMLQIENILLDTGSINEAANIIKKIRLIAQALLNMATISEVTKKIEDLQEIYNGNIWIDSEIDTIEHFRKSIRHLMKYLKENINIVKGVIIDYADETEKSDVIENPFNDIRTYKEKVIDYLVENSSNPTILKIRNLEPLTNDDFNYLEDVLWVQLGNKDEYYSISRIDNLAAFIRTIVGIEQEAINKAFSEFLNDNFLTSDQQEFIYSIINYVRENGDVEPQILIDEAPFDHFDINDLFGNNIPVISCVIKTLHNCITIN